MENSDYRFSYDRARVICKESDEPSKWDLGPHHHRKSHCSNMHVLDDLDVWFLIGLLPWIFKCQQ